MTAESQKKCFTVTWRIKNYNFFPEYSRYSPSFTVDILEKTKFILAVVASSVADENVMVVRLEKSGSEETILDYHFFVSSDQCSSSRFEKSFLDQPSNALQFEVPKKEVYKREAGKFLQPDFLTIQCKIWKKQGCLDEDGELMMITKPKMVRISFVGVVENFNDLKGGEMKEAIRIRSTSKESSQFSMNIDLTNRWKTFIDITSSDFKKIPVCKWVLYLLDSTGNEMKCGEGKFIYNGRRIVPFWRIPVQFSKRNSMELDKKYLPNDCLSLQCEMTYTTGELEHKFVKTKYAANLPNSIEMQNKAEVVGDDNQLKCTLQYDLMSLLSSGTFSDAKLRTATETFPAHKNILSARSPVFNAMFNSSMKEKISDCVEIEDLDAETVRRLLLFMYSDNLPALDFEIAKKLYFAGDKYEVLALKNKCSCFLQENLCPSNCCDVLVFADRHGDCDLKKAAQECIAEHCKEVLHSDEWKCVEEANAKLAFETFRAMYLSNWRNS